MAQEPAIAVLEFTSIARGFTTLDVMIKKAPIRVLEHGVISPGKYLIVVTGDVATVEEAYLAGLEHGDARLVDHLFLPYIHEGILPAIEGHIDVETVDAVGIVEAYSAASTLRAGDLAIKAANIQILELRFAKHLGGKGYFTLTGPQEEVEAAIEAARAFLVKAGLLVATEIINRPHEEFIDGIKGRPGTIFHRKS